MSFQSPFLGDLLCWYIIILPRWWYGSLSIPVFRGLTLLGWLGSLLCIYGYQLSIPVFRGLTLLVRYDRSHPTKIRLLSIPVFRGLTLLVYYNFAEVVVWEPFNPRF